MSKPINQAIEQTGKIILGKHTAIRQAISCLLAGGHLLIEDIPGVGKTTLAQALAQTMGLAYQRIQFTSDLLPGDIIGTSVYDRSEGSFRFHPGPIFSQMVLADEVNRATPKTQSALLEAMEEQQVTIDGETRALPEPFFVIATQNPVEHEGTYRLPEAQLDRFLFKIKIDYPNVEQEVSILQNAGTRAGKLEIDEVGAVVTADEIMEFQDLVHQVIVEPQLLHYIATIVDKTRAHSSLYLGASPRASLAILRASRAFAALEGRDFVTPEDIHEVVYPVLTHRIILSPEKEMEGVKPETVIRQIVDSVEVPR